MAFAGGLPSIWYLCCLCARRGDGGKEMRVSGRDEIGGQYGVDWHRVKPATIESEFNPIFHWIFFYCPLFIFSFFSSILFRFVESQLNCQCMAIMGLRSRLGANKIRRPKLIFLYCICGGRADGLDRGVGWTDVDDMGHWKSAIRFLRVQDVANNVKNCIISLFFKSWWFMRDKRRHAMRHRSRLLFLF